MCPEMITAKGPKPDRRTERTRQALMGACVALLLSEGLEILTVGRIVEHANVGRSTFYTHFRGRDDILGATMVRPSGPLADIVDRDVGPATLLPLLAHLLGQRRLSRVFFTGPLRRVWVNCLAGMIEPRLVSLAPRSRARPLLPLPLVALEVAEVQIGLVSHWLAGRQAARPEAVALALIASTRAVVNALLACGPEPTTTTRGEPSR